MTDSETSAKSATKPSAVSPVLRFSDHAALNAAAYVLNNWKISDEVRHALEEQEVNELQRSIAVALINAAQQAAHTGSITTINSILENEEIGKTAEGEHELHVRVVQEERRVADLLHLMRDVDHTFLSLCTSLNDLTALTEDPVMLQNLKSLRAGVMATEEIVRKNIELNTPEE